MNADIAVCSDAKIAVQALLAQLDEKVANGAERARDLREAQRGLRNDDYAAFFDAVRAALPNVVIAGDSTQPTYHAWLHYETEQRGNRVSNGKPENRGEYIRLMTELIAIAFQQDLTRVATLVIDPERWDTPRMYHGVFDSPQNHHVLTHTKGDEAKETLKKIDRFHVDQFAHFVRLLSDIPEAGGSLLDNCLVTYGSGMGNGTVHDYNDLPIVTAGGLGGKFRTGRHYKFDNKVPVANLWLTVANRAGIEVDGFADSTRALEL